MKIPVLLEITPQLNVAVIYRACSRCNTEIGPFFPFDLHKCVEALYCKICTSVLSKKDIVKKSS